MKHALREWVEVQVGNSVEIGKRWHGAIRLLFVDGDHSFEAIGADVKAWSQYIVPEGAIVFHDVGVWPGVTKFYREFLAANPAWREVAAILSLRIIVSA